MQDSPCLETLQGKLEKEKKIFPYQLCVIEQTLVLSLRSQRESGFPKPGGQQPGRCLLATEAEDPTEACRAAPPGRAVSWRRVLRSKERNFPTGNN